MMRALQFAAIAAFGVRLAAERLVAAAHAAAAWRGFALRNSHTRGLQCGGMNTGRPASAVGRGRRAAVHVTDINFSEPRDLAERAVTCKAGCARGNRTRGKKDLGALPPDPHQGEAALDRQFLKARQEGVMGVVGCGCRVGTCTVRAIGTQPSELSWPRGRAGSRFSSAAKAPALRSACSSGSSAPGFRGNGSRARASCSLAASPRSRVSPS